MLGLPSLYFTPRKRYSAPQRYSALRRVRGDGNCFYRSFLFGYLERLLQGIKSVGDANTKAMLELSRLRQVVHDRCVRARCCLSLPWLSGMPSLTSCPSISTFSWRSSCFVRACGTLSGAHRGMRQPRSLGCTSALRFALLVKTCNIRPDHYLASPSALYEAIGCRSKRAPTAAIHPFVAPPRIDHGGYSSNVKNVKRDHDQQPLLAV